MLLIWLLNEVMEVSKMLMCILTSALSQYQLVGFDNVLMVSLSIDTPSR